MLVISYFEGLSVASTSYIKLVEILSKETIPRFCEIYPKKPGSRTIGIKMAMVGTTVVFAMVIMPVMIAMLVVTVVVVVVLV